MDERMRDELLLKYLNKNVYNIIIDYLTDLPILPYIDELHRETELISHDNDWCYLNYYIRKIRENQLIYTTREYRVNEIPKIKYSCASKWYVSG